MFDRDEPSDSAWVRLAGGSKRTIGGVIHAARDTASRWAAIGPDTRRGRRFGAFGRGSVICFPHDAIMNERYIRIGAGTMIGPHVTLSAGMVPGQECVTDPVVSIGDRCLIGRGSGIVGHLGIEIGDDVWTGHYVYITDQNHGYDDLGRPISQQSQPERPGHDRRRLVARARHGGVARIADRPPRRDRCQQRGFRDDPRFQHRRRRSRPRREAPGRSVTAVSG